MPVSPSFPSPSPLRVGLLGAGGIADSHARVVKSLPGVDLVGVADLDLMKARRLRERWHAGAAYSSLAEMQKEAQPDVVHVLLPPEHHAKLALQALAAGTHVLVEKPLCVSEAECRELESAAAERGRLVAVNHNVTFEPAYLRLIEYIRARRLGAVQHVNVFWSVPFGANTFDAPLYQKEGPGAVILETGPHPLSLLVRLMGEVKSATALVSAETQGLPDTWQLSLQCERGTAQCFIAINRTFTETRVHVIGEDGVAFADLRLGYAAIVDNTRFAPLFFKLADTMALARSLAATAARNFAERARLIPSGGACDDGGRVMHASIASFYRAIRAGRKPPASLDEGLAVVRSCLRVIEASGMANAGEKEVSPWRESASS